MGKLFRFEIKRLTSRPWTLLVSLLLPIILMTALTSPFLDQLLSRGALPDVSIALYNADDSPTTRMIINNLIQSDSINGFVQIIDVTDPADGYTLTDSGQTQAFVLIPEGMQYTLYNGGHVTVGYYDTGDPIARLIHDMLGEAVSSINDAQQAVNAIYDGMITIGYTSADAAAQYQQTAQSLYLRILGRSSIFTQREAAVFGPVRQLEYYLIAAMLLTVMFSAIHIAVMAHHDIHSGVLIRGLPVRHPRGYYGAKLLSGTLFVTLQLLLTLLLLTLLIRPGGRALSRIVPLMGNALFFGWIITAVMLALGSTIRSASAVVWSAFTGILLVALASGLLIPWSLLPDWVQRIAVYTAIPGVFNRLANAVFGTHLPTTPIHWLWSAMWGTLGSLLLIQSVGRRFRYGENAG